MFRTFHPIFIFICKNVEGMWRVSNKLGRAGRRLLLGAAVIGLSCPQLALADDPPAPTTPPVIFGHYKVIVRGFVTGTGQANVSPGSVSISATVKGSDGTITPLAITCPMDGDHFKGNGTFMSLGMVVEGRVEGADPGKKLNPQTGIVTDAHVGATFRLSDGHSGRIVGVMDKAAQVGS